MIWMVGGTCMDSKFKDVFESVLTRNEVDQRPGEKKFFFFFGLTDSLIHEGGKSFCIIASQDGKTP